MTRIELFDDAKSMFIKMSDGNPGAMQAMIVLLSDEIAEIDRDSVMPFFSVLTLDSLGIYGTGIYILWNDKCKKDSRRLIMLLRATQLGFLPGDKVKEMAADQMRQINLSDDEWVELDAKVCDRLSRFMSVETWTAQQERLEKERIERDELLEKEQIDRDELLDRSVIVLDAVEE